MAKTSAVSRIHPKVKGKQVIKSPPLDPRKAAMIAAYTNPESPTFGNARGSAVGAGFTEQYADNILHLRPKWLSGFMGDDDLVSKARQHIKEVLAMPVVAQAMGAFGPIYEAVPTGEFEEKKNPKTGEIELVEKMDNKPVMTYVTARIKEKSTVAKMTLDALDPKFKKKDEGKGNNTFVFNVHPVKDQYKTQPLPVDSREV